MKNYDPSFSRLLRENVSSGLSAEGTLINFLLPQSPLWKEEEETKT